MDADLISQRLVEQKLAELREALIFIDSERMQVRDEIARLEELHDQIILKRWLQPDALAQP